MTINRRPFVNSYTCLLFLFALILFSCSRGQEKQNSLSGSVQNIQNTARPFLALSTLPQEYFARRIGGDRIQTMVLAGSGQNPHSYEPNPVQLQALSGADVWMLSGTEFEIALEPRIRNLFPSLKIVDGTEGIHFRMAEDEPDIDRHTWLGSEGAQIMALHIRDALCGMDEANSAFYSENYSELAADIQREFGKLRTELEGLRGKTILVYHPAFGYFLDEFGIIQEAIEADGKEPSPRMLAQIIEKAKSEKVRVIFVQAQFPAESVRTIAAEVGAELVVLDPLAPDWLGNIRIMGEALKRAAQSN